MTIEEIKGKLAGISGHAPTDITVNVDPLEAENFSLKIAVGGVRTLDTSDLSKLLDLGKEAGMQVYVIPESEETVWLQLKKEPISLSI